jgi:hypothetical protein
VVGLDRELVAHHAPTALRHGELLRDRADSRCADLAADDVLYARRGIAELAARSSQAT